MKEGREGGESAEWERETRVHTKKTPFALFLAAFVFLFPNVMSFSAIRCASLALGQVVLMDSCVMRLVTRLRRRACRCEEVRLRWRYLGLLPAISDYTNNLFPHDCLADIWSCGGCCGIGMVEKLILPYP